MSYNVVLSDSRFKAVLSKDRPFNVIISTVGPQGPSGASTVEGDLTNIDSITFRYNGNTYTLRVVGEDEFGNPTVRWAKVA